MLICMRGSNTTKLLQKRGWGKTAIKLPKSMARERPLAIYFCRLFTIFESIQAGVIS